MADKMTLFFPGTMSSLKALEITCNTNEINLDANLISLDTVLVGTAKGTEAVFDPDKKEKLGEMTIKKSATSEDPKPAFKGKAFIVSMSTDVSVFR